MGHGKLIFERFIQKQEIPADVLQTENNKFREELFTKGLLSIRAAALTSRYGFRAHCKEGKMAIYSMESDEYKTHP